MELIVETLKRKLVFKRKKVMKKLSKVYEKLEKIKFKLKTKEYEYSKLDQIAALDSVGTSLDNQIQVLKGYIKALEWILS